jgi:hypothetical protein
MRLRYLPRRQKPGETVKLEPSALKNHELVAIIWAKHKERRRIQVSKRDNYYRGEEK